MKKTCLWLKGLPPLIPTEIVSPGDFIEAKTGSGRKYNVGASSVYAIKDGKILAWNNPETAKIRSKTFPGIAEAMANQWG